MLKRSHYYLRMSSDQEVDYTLLMLVQTLLTQWVVSNLLSHLSSNEMNDISWFPRFRRSMWHIPHRPFLEGEGMPQTPTLLHEGTPGRPRVAMRASSRIQSPQKAQELPTLQLNLSRKEKIRKVDWNGTALCPKRMLSQFLSSQGCLNPDIDSSRLLR